MIVPIAFFSVTVAVLGAATLPGTEPLEMAGDPAAQMVEQIKEYLLRATTASRQTRKPDVERLRYILGVVDKRIPFTQPESFPPTKGPGYTVRPVRWPVLEDINAEGILMEARSPRAFVVAIPDASQEPEQFADAQRLAAAGFTVLVPTLINRQDTYSGNPDIRMTNQPHREWLYRITYPLGRHIAGLEVQKVLAAIDWFQLRVPQKPIGVWGYGEGGALALYAAALDNRIGTAGVSGYFGPREGLWKEPIYRNIWGVLKDFGDAELASLIAPRRLIVDATPGPQVEEEVRRAGKAEMGSLQDFISALGGGTRASRAIAIPAPDNAARQLRAIREIEQYCDRLVERSDRERSRAWARDGAEAIRNRMRTTIVGELPQAMVPLRPRTRSIPPGPNWSGYEVVLDAAPGVMAYGVLLLPSNRPAGQKLPVVVMQHGLDGRPQDLYSQTAGRARDVYQNVGQSLVDAGFIVYLPQNPYIHDFRPINRMANPLALTMFSFILRQHEKTIEWLQSLPFVDGQRIGFYGLSYGGTTALRVPPLVNAYAVSICSGNFNEWIRKLTTRTEPYSYMFTKEYEILEFDIAHIASHAEMAMLTAPRPFLVERGHADGVGIDEWVAYEYAKVARYYARRGLADRTGIAYFEGLHRIDGAVAIPFLKRHLAAGKAP